MPVQPLLSERWAKRLQVKARASMRHTVYLQTEQTVPKPNGEPVKTWVDAAPVRGLLMLGGTAVAELAAASGVEATGTLRLELGTAARAGMRARVVGTTRGVAWVRTVELKSGADVTNRLFALVLVSDVVLNR